MATLAYDVSGPASWSQVPRLERRAAAVLLAVSLAYGAALFVISGVGAAALAPVVLGFVAVAALAAAAAYSGYGFVMALRGQTSGGGGAMAFRLGVAALVTGLTIPFFGIFKQMILPTRGFAWDPALAAFERGLFGGASPWTFSHALLGYRGTLFLDLVYSSWMLLLIAFPMLCAVVVRSPQLRVRLLANWLFAWLVIGTCAAWLMASAGPVYYNALVGPDAEFALLNARLASLDQVAVASGTSIKALQFQPALLAAFQAGDYAPAGGISAAPSMHIAMATLFAIGGFAVARWLGWLLVAYALLIWVGSVHLGWHYAVDGPIAAALMLGIWKLSGLVVRPAHSHSIVPGGLDV